MRTGLPIALLSAAAFGLSGSLASPLLATGWSPAAVVAIRVGGAFLVLLLPCLLLLRRTGLPSLRTSGRMVVYGLVAVAGAQLCYFSAVQHLSVGVALLLEYSAPVLLIGWLWWRRGQRPTAAKLVGAAFAIAGLVLVLDLTSGARVSPVGVAWGLGAALCLCAYFLLSEHTDAAPPALLLTTVGTGVGASVLVLAGLIGIVPLTAASASVTLGGHSLPWWAPLLALALVTAALAYLTGIEAVRRLGSSVASFVALFEVVLAVVFAALLLGQVPTPTQAVGGALILIGIAVVQTTPAALRTVVHSVYARTHGR
ncbi:MAG TPA: DMT family transporter [Microlunatus sp.]|nr:DMT family transporter [Microlunatus sp.]